MWLDWIAEESRGVSPVIGTILVVAVVVILAAVIGATAFGFTDDINEPPDKAVLDLDFKEADAEAPAYDEFLWEIELTHQGGEDVSGEDITVTLTHGSVELTGEYDETLTSGDEVRVAVIHTNGGHEDFDCGDENTACSLAGDEENFPDDDEMELLMIHEPSNTILYEETIDFSGNYGIYNDEEERSDDVLTFSSE